MSNRPYGPELRNLPYVRALSVSEHAAMDQMIEAYYMHTPTNTSTPTPEPSHLVSQEATDEGTLRREIVGRAREQLEYPERRQRMAEQVASAALHGPGAWDESPNGAETTGGARGSEEAFVLRLPVDQVPDDVDSQAYEMDHQIAAAASLLYQYGYDFDWEQLTPDQQDIYHSMIGRLLQSIEEVD